MPPTPETKYSPLLSRSSFVAAGCSSAIFFNTPLRANGTAYFNITAVATDDDSVAYDYADFEVEITGIGTGSGITPEPPKVPILDVGLNSGTEDFELILNNVTAAQHPDDGTNPTISIILSDIPEGFDVIGAVWNPVDNYWVASAKDFDEGSGCPLSNDSEKVESFCAYAHLTPPQGSCSGSPFFARPSSC